MSHPKAEEASIPPPPESGENPRDEGRYARLLKTLESLSGESHKMAQASSRTKYEFPNAPVPCDEGRKRGCKTACCTLYFELSEEDLAQGFEYEPSMPYAIRHEADGYCYLLDRKTHQCTVWENRPKTCRIFDCRLKESFKHLWED